MPTIPEEEEEEEEGATTQQEVKPRRGSHLSTETGNEVTLCPKRPFTQGY